MKTSNERWRQPTVIRYEYNEYMVHHYAYMAKVADVCKLESYVEVEKDANWRAAINKEMRALATNETSNLVDTPKGVKPIG